jgi:ornithine carbamoyltransferase
MAGAAAVPVINALTDEHHPCQALADLLTIRERFGTLGGLRIAYVGDGNNVAHSLLEAGALMGCSVSLATPLDYRADEEIVSDAAEVAMPRGGSVLVTDDPAEAVTGAHVIYTDVWVSMGEDADRAERVERLRPYQVDESLMGRARDDAIFMHCLPAHRGEEVSAAVIDGDRSVVLQQAANRLPTEQAVLETLIGGRQL